MVDHPNIKMTTSIVDFIFRCLAYEYMGRTDLVHVLDKPEVSNLGDEPEVKQELSSVRITPSAPVNGSQSLQPQKQHKAVAAKVDGGLDAVNAAAKNMQSDAPSCSTCGHITIRSGTCYKCMNCGTSMGCS